MLHSQMKIVNCAVSTNDLHYKGKHLMFHDVVLFVLVLKDFTDHIVNRARNKTNITFNSCLGDTVTF
jgi:hypothetical protein